MESISKNPTSAKKLIDEYHENNVENPQPHLELSALGHPCDRWLWLQFRWAVRKVFEGEIVKNEQEKKTKESTT